MVDDVRPDEDQKAVPPPQASAVEEAPPPPKAAVTPRLIRLEVQTDGTPDNTRLVDRDTGEELRLDAHVYAQVEGGAGQPGRAYVQAVFADVPVVAAGNVFRPFVLAGVVLGKSGAPPAAAVLAAVPPPPAAPAPQGGGPPAGLPGTGAARDHAAAAAHNRALNQR
jgi:hypothetical protein